MTKKGGTAIQRNPAQLLSDRAAIAQWLLEGKPQWFMAGELALPIDTIENDVRAIKRLWLKSSIVDFDAARAAELEQLKHIRDEAWEQYRRSLEPRTKTTKTTAQLAAGNVAAPANPGPAVVISERVETATFTGNPVYLELALKTTDRICKLLGLDAPERSLTMSLELVKVYTGVDLERV